MALKCDGELQAAMKRFARRAWVGWAALYVVATIVTFFAAPSLLAALPGNPLGWVALLALLGALIYVPVALRAGQLRRAFLASATAVVAMLGQVGLGLYPRLVPSSVDPAYSLTIANASSSPRTLLTMLVIALVGMPLVVGYTVFIYRVFKGKVELTEHSY
jgi:cytochrome d ubiquinol oxidase subunit II